MDLQRSNWTHSLPTLVAIAVGAIYGFGAITIYGQINGAGANAVQSVGLVPIDQILSRGIGAFVSTAGLLLVVLLAALFAPWYLPRESGGGTGQGRGEATARVLAAATVVFVVATADMKEGLVFLIAGIPSIGAAVAMRRLTRRRNDPEVRAAVLGTFVTGIVFILSLSIWTAVLRPSPLPAVTMDLRDGSSISGGLITTSNGFWYVAQEDGHIKSVSSRQITTSDISHRNRSPEQSIVEWIFGWSPA